MLIAPLLVSYSIFIFIFILMLLAISIYGLFIFFSRSIAIFVCGYEATNSACEISSIYSPAHVIAEPSYSPIVRIFIFSSDRFLSKPPSNEMCQSIS